MTLYNPQSWYNYTPMKSKNISILWSTMRRLWLEIYTGKPYVKKLIVNVRNTSLLNRTLVCLTPDLQHSTAGINEQKNYNNNTNTPSKDKRWIDDFSTFSQETVANGCEQGVKKEKTNILMRKWKIILCKPDINNLSLRPQFTNEKWMLRGKKLLH